MKQGPKEVEQTDNDKTVSLSPLKLKEALMGLLAVKPPPEARSEKKKKKSRPAKKRDG